MRKIHTLLTGIVLSLTILLAGSFKPATDNDDSNGPQNLKKVEIYCKAYEKDGVIHFEMYDSNNPTVKGDNITTDVMPGAIVTWQWTPDSEIQEFVRIHPKKAGPIMTGNAKKVPGTKKLRLKVPKKAKIPSPKEKYDIVIKDKDGNDYPIDPYLRIPNLGN
jgi:hypothetical protein